MKSAMWGCAPQLPLPGFSMTCAPCLKVRGAAVAVAKGVTSGDLRAVRSAASDLRAALAEKAESLRVRAITARKS